MQKVNNMKLGIIGGSGLYDIGKIDNEEWIKVTTPWGNPSDDILKCIIEDKEIIFLPRHGRGHRINPSNINYRANIDALKQHGVTDIISVSAVGSLKEEHAPGKFVIVDQFIDRTFARKKTFFDDEIVAHVSLAKPICEQLSNICENALRKLNIDYASSGTYLAMEGPQFSTYAESCLYRSWGLDVIGMTNMPEAKLAREAEIRYATIAMVTDYDCWHSMHDDVDIEMIIQTLNKNVGNAKNLIVEIIRNFIIDETKDYIHTCLDGAIITDSSMMKKETKKKLETVAGRVLPK
tara:strand:+ start:815 stop:1693 length:879 start_codon:yes stop_codon:yes gene_type:complete